MVTTLMSDYITEAPSPIYTTNCIVVSVMLFVLSCIPPPCARFGHVGQCIIHIVAIGKLKGGKSYGDTLMSDYITEAPSPICQFLAHLFTSMLRHGFMPLSFRDAIIQQIPKESPCLQIITESLLPPLSVKLWTSSRRSTSRQMTYSLGLCQAFPLSAIKI